LFYALNTIYHVYKNESVNVVKGKSFYLIRDTCKTHKSTMWAEHGILMLHFILHKVTTSF